MEMRKCPKCHRMFPKDEIQGYCDECLKEFIENEDKKKKVYYKGKLVE